MSETDPHMPEPEPWFYVVRKTRFVPANAIGALVLLSCIVGLIGSVLVAIRAFRTDNTAIGIVSIVIGIVAFCFLNWACATKSAPHPLDRKD